MDPHGRRISSRVNQVPNFEGHNFSSLSKGGPQFRFIRYMKVSLTDFCSREDSVCLLPSHLFLTAAEGEGKDPTTRSPIETRQSDLVEMPAKVSWLSGR